MTETTPDRGRILQMRLVVEATDYDEALRFYRDALGAPEELTVHGANGEKVTILQVGRATLELSNPAQVEMIDRVEVGRRVSPHMRVAFEVSDATTATDDLLDSGARLVAPPTRSEDTVQVSRVARWAGAGRSTRRGRHATAPAPA